MQFYDHPQCNTTLNPAVGDESSVAALPVCKGNMGIIPVVRSYWVPTQEEMQLLASGQFCIALSIVGQTHAPIRLDVVDAEVSAHRIKHMADKAVAKLITPNGPGPNDKVN